MSNSVNFWSEKKGEKSNNESQHFDEFFAFLNTKNFRLQLEIFVKKYKKNCSSLLGS